MDLSIYLIASLDDGLEKIEEALQAGVNIIQLREKGISSKMYFERALTLRALTKKYHIPLIINDRVDIALACGAEGVHLGQEDVPVHIVRQLVGKTFIIGATAKTVDSAVKAELWGAQYIGSGAWFPTCTKEDATPIDREEYKKLKELVHIPSVAIGGLNVGNCHIPMAYGADGIAMASGILSSSNITETVRNIKQVINQNRPIT